METPRLEAIMFTDIAGYSRLMEQDEERTIALLKVHNTIVLPIIESHSGRVIDSIGDGLLVVFPSVRSAVRCALATQQAVGVHNDASPSDQHFRLRIGIHLGEVWHEDDRVFGTGVNVAARVQPFAIPGGICITEDVHRQVERAVDEQIVSIGVHPLKNIARSFELYRIVTGQEEEPVSGPATTEAAAKPEGELDQVKERILAELQKLGERQGKTGTAAAADERSLEHRIESKVYGLVEHVMDRALEKWDQMPDEKKADIVRKVKVEINSDRKGRHRHTRNDDDDDSPAKVAGQLAFGTAAGVGFGLGFFMFGVSWMVWPFAILGVLPFISSLRKIVKRSVQSRTERSARPAQLEREILGAAQQLGGRVTVVQIAASTGHTLDEVQDTLDRMTAKGYVSQEVLDSGVIRYDFPSLLGDGEE